MWIVTFHLKVLGTLGDRQLGGNQLTKAILDYCLKSFGSKHPNIDVRAPANKSAIRSLWDLCEKAKMTLSGKTLLTDSAVISFEISGSL